MVYPVIVSQCFLDIVRCPTTRFDANFVPNRSNYVTLIRLF